MGTWLRPESWKYLRYFRWNHFCRFQSNWLRFWFQFQFLISPVSFFYLCNNFLIIYSGQTDLRRLSVTRYNASRLAILGLEKNPNTSASTISRKLIDLKKELLGKPSMLLSQPCKKKKKKRKFPTWHWLLQLDFLRLSSLLFHPQTIVSRPRGSERVRNLRPVRICWVTLFHQNPPRYEGLENIW